VADLASFYRVNVVFQPKTALSALKQLFFIEELSAVGGKL
jgi:hypothetical protein